MKDTKNEIPKERELLSGRELIMYSMKFCKEDKKRSWFELIINLTLLTITCFFTFYFDNLWLKFISSIFYALMIVRNFIVYHDYLHGAILKKSKLAKGIMTVFGWWILAPTKIWSRTHNYHHNHNSKLSNNGIGSFPLISRTEYNALSKKDQLMYRLSRHWVTIFGGYITLFVLDFNVKSIILQPKVHWDSFVSLGLHIGLGILVYVYGGEYAMIFSWFLPFFLAFGLGAYLFYVQHNFTDATFKNNREWDYNEAAMESTSFLDINPVMHWFTGNIGYHHVHHVNHRIPFYRLKEAMEDMPELQNPKRTNLNPLEIYRCLKLKIWDEEKGEITSF